MVARQPFGDIMEEFEKIDEAFDVIEKAVEKVGKKHLTTFGRAELNKFEKDTLDLRARAVNLQYETMG